MTTETKHSPNCDLVTNDGYACTCNPGYGWMTTTETDPRSVAIARRRGLRDAHEFHIGQRVETMSGATGTLESRKYEDPYNPNNDRWEVNLDGVGRQVFVAYVLTPSDGDVS